MTTASALSFRIAVVTVARSDFGILLPVLRQLKDQAWCDLSLIAAAAHLSQKHGETLEWVCREGFQADAMVPTSDETDTPAQVGRATAKAVSGFTTAYEKLRPDLLILLGDRFEMHAAAVAAVPFRIPIAHIHGGEITEGAIDECYRHSITKMSHLHFASTQAHADRIVQMGEAPDHVVACGAPGLDQLQGFQPLTRDELQSRLNLSLSKRPLAITFHPETLGYLRAEDQLTSLMTVLKTADHPLVISQPNADPGNAKIREAWERFAAQAPDRIRLVANMGTQTYFSLLHHAAAMVGNSSSGIVEAASFGLPVVNVGDRQKGRMAGRNVIHCRNEVDSIRSAVLQACDDSFRRGLQAMANLYGDGHASERIVSVLQARLVTGLSTRKPFYDLPPAAVRANLHGLPKEAAA
ncbi:MAG: UDP-N-acetylglucosamine 2-epimerase [Planctomycetota bacterium]